MELIDRPEIELNIRSMLSIVLNIVRSTAQTFAFPGPDKSRIRIRPLKVGQKCSQPWTPSDRQCPIHSQVFRQRSQPRQTLQEQVPLHVKEVLRPGFQHVAIQDLQVV